MNENDKKLMNDCYMAEIKTNALDAKPSTVKGFIRGYEKAFSLHVVMQRSELLLAFTEWVNEQPTSKIFYSNNKQLIDEYLSQ